jgi:hypothetical protein
MSWARAAWLLLCACCIACQQRAIDVGCRRACRAAQACGLLPSDLGAGDNPSENCEARCSLSSGHSGAARSGVLRCLEEVDAGASGWDSAQAPCRRAAQCLHERFPSQQFGIGSVTAVLHAPPVGASTGATDAGCAPAEPAHDCASAATGRSDECGLRVAAFCAEFRVGLLKLFVQRDETRLAERTLSCSDGLEHEIVFSDLSAGSIRLGVELSGALDPDTDGGAGTVESAEAALAGAPPTGAERPGRLYCRTLLGRNGVLQADQRRRLSLELLAADCAYPGCEASAAACMDQTDNDADGYVDCADADCTCPR